MYRHRACQLRKMERFELRIHSKVYHSNKYITFVYFSKKKSTNCDLLQLFLYDDVSQFFWKSVRFFFTYCTLYSALHLTVKTITKDVLTIMKIFFFIFEIFQCIYIQKYKRLTSKTSKITTNPNQACYLVFHFFS